MKKCPQCRAVLEISSFDEIKDMSVLTVNKYISSYKATLAENPSDKRADMSMGICYLRLKVYDKAQAAFDRAIEDNFDNADAYFYSAVCLLGGRKAFLAARQIIDRAMEYINAAIMIEPRGIYYLFSAYIKYDYFARKAYNVTPDYNSDLAQAKACGNFNAASAELFSLLNVERPSALI